MTETLYQANVVRLQDSLSTGFADACQANKKAILAEVGGASAIALGLAWPLAVKVGTIAARYLARVALRHLGQMQVADVLDLIQAFRAKEYAGR